jgi:hypothetical protein
MLVEITGVMSIGQCLNEASSILMVQIFIYDMNS